MLLNDYLSCKDEAHAFIEPFGAQNIDLGQVWRILVFQLDATRNAPHSSGDACSFDLRITSTIDTCLKDEQIPAISAVRGDKLVTLAVFDSAPCDCVRETVTKLAQLVQAECADTRVVVGVSSPRVSPFYPAAPFQQALESARSAAEGMGVVNGVVLFDESGIRFKLLEGQSGEVLAMMCGRFIQPLAQYDLQNHSALLATLRTYFENNMSIQQTSPALHIHRNTLRQRLRRIEEVLNIHLDRTGDVLEVFVALRASELLN
jgi:sugar diacid utilization regulator